MKFLSKTEYEKVCAKLVAGGKYIAVSIIAEVQVQMVHALSRKKSRSLLAWLCL